MANPRMYYAGFVLIVAFMLSYVFWGADVIPDTLATLGPGVVAAYFDDAVMVVAGIFALGKWRQITMGGPNREGFGWRGYVVFIPIVLAGLLYVFWGVDLIPDSTPYVGWFDDAAAVLIMFYTLGRVRKSLK